MSELLLANEVMDTANPRVYFEVKASAGRIWLTIQTIGSEPRRVKVLLNMEDATEVADAVADAVIEAKKGQK
ncbi:MAG: hypothetical protein JRM77_06955 [Nitrososphaerota archaeon]|nr:hypothetical protein [Nitrososphaerota archaeon]